MAEQTTLAWCFKSPLGFGQLIKRLRDHWKAPDMWKLSNSENEDYLAGRITPETVVRIYLVKPGEYVANMRFASKSGDSHAQFEAGKAKLFSDVLSVVEAQDVKPCEPYE